MDTEEKAFFKEKRKRRKRFKVKIVQWHKNTQILVIDLDALHLLLKYKIDSFDVAI